MSTKQNHIREYIQKASLGENKSAKYLFLTEILDKKVRTESGITIGKLKDLIIRDDRRYAEVTGLIVERS